MIFWGGWWTAFTKGKHKTVFIMSYFPYIYTVLESECQVEGYKYTGYGIRVRNLQTDESRAFFDISVRRGDVEELVDRCNRLGLDPVHIDDVIEDFLFAV